MNKKIILLATLNLLAYTSSLVCMQLSDSDLSDQLKEAISNNSQQAALKALIAGANPNRFEVGRIKLFDGHSVLLETPLIAAAERGRAQICEQLIERGAKTKEKDSNGWTPLLWAAQSGEIHVCRILLAHGASLDEVEQKKKNSPLDLAAFEGHEEVVKLLLNDYAMKLFKEHKTELQAALASGDDSDALIAKMRAQIKDQFRPTLAHALSLTTVHKLKLLLNPDDFGSNFGPDIETEMRKQLGLIKPQPALVPVAPASGHQNRDNNAHDKSSDNTKKCSVQ
jgi:ankyrin repeat protein